MAKGEETRTAILQQATALASVGGLESLTVGALADAMGMSKSGVFAHFRSKDSLDVAVLEFVRERFIGEVLQPSIKAKRGIPRIEALLERMSAWLTADFLPGGCPLLAAGFELDGKPGPARDLVVSMQRDHVAVFAQAARIAVEEAHFRADLDVDQFAFEIYGAILAAHQALQLFRDSRAVERFRVATDKTISLARR